MGTGAPEPPNGPTLDSSTPRGRGAVHPRELLTTLDRVPEAWTKCEQRTMDPKGGEIENLGSKLVEE